MWVNEATHESLKDHPEFIKMDGRGVQFQKGGEVEKALATEKAPGSYDDVLCTIDYEDFRRRFREFLKKQERRKQFSDDFARKRVDRILPDDEKKWVPSSRSLCRPAKDMVNMMKMVFSRFTGASFPRGNSKSARKA